MARTALYTGLTTCMVGVLGADWERTGMALDARNNSWQMLDDGRDEIILCRMYIIISLHSHDFTPRPSVSNGVLRDNQSSCLNTPCR